MCSICCSVLSIGTMLFQRGALPPSVCVFQRGHCRPLWCYFYVLKLHPQRLCATQRAGRAEMCQKLRDCFGTFC
uniref:Uncharacterized protein n=1 Tax=Rhipicephalus pulchellus TaxID=72859 RepID=L7LUG4_RHIPC